MVVNLNNLTQIRDYKDLINRYDQWSKEYDASPIRIINGDQYDFIERKEDRNTVLNMIESKLVELGKLSPERFEEIKANRKEGKVKLG